VSEHGLWTCCNYTCIIPPDPHHSSQQAAIGRGTGRACRRSQGRPESRTDSCNADSRTTPSVTGGHLNRPASSRCNSPRNAGFPAVSTQLVRITHPFHPFGGRQLACVGERYNRSGKRLLLRVDDKTVCSLPPQWTDAVAPDPEVVMGQGRALFRIVDLMELSSLVTRLARERHCETSAGCRDNYAASVRGMMPQKRQYEP
jgi:hypothetical protein